MGGVGQFAIQPRKERVIRQVRPKLSASSVPVGVPVVGKPKTEVKRVRIDYDARLMEAAAKGDASGVEEAITSGASIEAKNSDGCTPFLFAV